MLDYKGAAVSPPERYLRLPLAPKSTAAKKGRVADIPIMLHKDEAGKTAYGATIIKLDSSFVPSIRRFDTLIDSAFRTGNQQPTKQKARSDQNEEEYASQSADHFSDRGPFHRIIPTNFSNK